MSEVSYNQKEPTVFQMLAKKMSLNQPIVIYEILFSNSSYLSNCFLSVFGKVEIKFTEMVVMDLWTHSDVQSTNLNVSDFQHILGTIYKYYNGSMKPRFHKPQNLGHRNVSQAKCSSNDVLYTNK